ncbi:MAG: response regulator [Candidatus Sericytochromatia bacterium]|jgi:two-component system chemotaxis response regulator CheY|uniref:Response regulator n=1 Tax=Candidatus Tanganyikabacteria bacterium TaxID=2961651 RepID=A0A937X2M0_9BACT|nr:response regulator [Candidatus Tanganyikabacteria bacterium]
MSDDKKIRVMIVDDSLTLRTMFKKSLTDTEFDTVAEAADGGEALEKYKQHRPDLVVMDIVMPEVDGVTALSNIIDFDPEAKVIMVSSLGSKDKVLESIKKGAKNFIMKPFERDTLLQALKKAYEGRV